MLTFERRRKMKELGDKYKQLSLLQQAMINVIACYKISQSDKQKKSYWEWYNRYRQDIDRVDKEIRELLVELGGL